jgi:hypothetical protein
VLLHVAIERRLSASVADFCVVCVGCVDVCFGCSVMYFEVCVVEGGCLFSNERCCRYGWAPIHEASRWDDSCCLEFLVAHNADVNAQTE